MRAAAAVAVVLSACAYREGSFAYSDHAFAGQRTTIGCLDLAIDRRHDGDGVAVLVYDFGNRCDRAVTIDLAYATVTGRMETGEQVRLKAYDPNNEIRPLELDGRSVGGETIAYASEPHLAQVCVDVATIVHATGQTKVICAASQLDRRHTSSSSPSTAGTIAMPWGAASSRQRAMIASTSSSL